jgi:IclR family pca regulon transcriptional regulator
MSHVPARASIPKTPVGPGDDTDERLYVASVEKAMRVLSAFGPEQRWMSLAEIAAASGIGRSAAQRFVYTWLRLGYLQRDPVTRRYCLAIRLLSLVRGMLAGHPMLERGQPVLADLARATGETVSWVELDGDEIVVVANIPSIHVTRVHLPVGSRFAALPSSSGQVLLWQAEASQLEAMFERLGSAERERLPVSDGAGLVPWLQRTRKAGYVLTERHLDAQGVSISAPVVDVQGRVTAAINISTLKSRHDAAAARRELVPRLIEAARKASA